MGRNHEAAPKLGNHRNNITKDYTPLNTPGTSNSPNPIIQEDAKGYTTFRHKHWRATHNNSRVTHEELTVSG